MVLERQAIQRGKPIKDEVSIIVDGQSFDGWTTVSITKNLESIANSFSIGLFDKFEGIKENWPFKHGQIVQINIGTERVFTGYIEVIQPEFGPKRRGFIIAGRSKAGDLIDSYHEGPSEYKNITLTNLAKELIAPFGLKVFESVEPKIINKFAVKPGETIFEALDRAAREQGLCFISTRAGNIRLTRAARERSFSSLEQNINLKFGSGIYDASQRHNSYTVKAQTAGLPDFFGPLASQAEGQAFDLGITRHRPFIMVSESSADSGKAKIRAEWEASSRLAKATRVNTQVVGWTQEDGSLWGINQVIAFTSSFLGLNRDLLSVVVTHTDEVNQSKLTNITLTDPKAYAPEPIKNSKLTDDIFASLGAGFLR